MILCIIYTDHQIKQDTERSKNAFLESKYKKYIIHINNE